MANNNQGRYPRQSESFKGKWGSPIKSSNVMQGMKSKKMMEPKDMMMKPMMPEKEMGMRSKIKSKMM